MITDSLIANAANAERVDRIKEAKSEAEALIAAYRAEMEANYQKKMNMVITTILPLSSASRNLICEEGGKCNYEKSAI
jgi:Vacuolar (H+)-ATPase G subunit